MCKSTECASKIKSIILLSFMQYVGLLLFVLPISIVMIVKIRELYLIIIKSEVWTSFHCLELGHETMVFLPNLKQ